jgi:hypothetical protein
LILRTSIGARLERRVANLRLRHIPTRSLSEKTIGNDELREVIADLPAPLGARAITPDNVSECLGRQQSPFAKLSVGSKQMLMRSLRHYMPTNADACSSPGCSGAALCACVSRTRIVRSAAFKATAFKLHSMGHQQELNLMAIIISQAGKNAVKVEKSAFDKEDFLQQYIYDNPESIPLYDIKEDIRLLVVAREFPTRSGPIDAIGIDQDGQIYIIETKLFRNPDKRTVIAQMLDYGAALWKHSADLTTSLDSEMLETFGMSLDSKLRGFFGLSEEENTFLLENVRRNLSGGVFRFIVLMDRLDSRLKDLVIYVNRNSSFDVYAVEVEYYKHEKQEIIIPKIFGAEAKKEVAISSGGSRKKWTEEAMLTDAQEKLSVEEFAAFKRIYEFSKDRGEVRLGTGSYGSFNPIFARLSTRSLFTLAADKRLSFNFDWIADDHAAESFKDRLESIGFKFPEHYRKIRPSVPASEWLPRVDKFLAILSDMLASSREPDSTKLISMQTDGS